MESSLMRGVCLRRPISGSRKPDMGSESAFTLIELLTTVAIIGVLAALAMAGLGNARKSAQEVSCISRLKSIGSSILLFAADHDNRLPTNGNNNPFESKATTTRYYTLIGPYIDVSNKSAAALRDLKLFHCPTLDLKPDITTTSIYNYTYNILIGVNDGNGGTSNDNFIPVSLGKISRPNETPMLWDCAGDTGSGSNPFVPTKTALKYGYTGATSATGLSPNHGAGCNILFVSGRVARANLSSINNFPWNGTAPGKTGANSVFDPFYAGSN